MRIARYIFRITLWSMLLLSCQRPSGSAVLLQQARGLAETNPDSALRLIDSIRLPEEHLSKKEYM